MDFGKLGLSVVVAGLLQVGTAQALTVTPVSSRVYVEARAAINGSDTAVRTAVDSQGATLRYFEANTQAQVLQGSDAWALAVSGVGASWEMPDQGWVNIMNVFYGSGNSAFANTKPVGGAANFEYTFTIDDAASFVLDARVSLSKNFDLSGDEAGKTFFEIASGLDRQTYSVENGVSGTAEKAFILAAGTHTLSIYSGLEVDWAESLPRDGVGEYNVRADWSIAAVPVPLPAVLLLTGLGGLGVVARRRRQG